MKTSKLIYSLAIFFTFSNFYCFAQLTENAASEIGAEVLNHQLPQLVFGVGNLLQRVALKEALLELSVHWKGNPQSKVRKAFVEQAADLIKNINESLSEIIPPMKKNIFVEKIFDKIKFPTNVVETPKDFGSMTPKEFTQFLKVAEAYPYEKVVLENLNIFKNVYESIYILLALDNSLTVNECKELCKAYSDFTKRSIDLVNGPLFQNVFIPNYAKDIERLRSSRKLMASKDGVVKDYAYILKSLKALFQGYIQTANERLKTLADAQIKDPNFFNDQKNIFYTCFSVTSPYDKVQSILFSITQFEL